MGRLDDYRSRELRERESAAKTAALEAERAAKDRQRAIDATARDLAEFEGEIARFLEAMQKRGNPGTRRIQVSFFRDVEAWWVHHYFWAHEWQSEKWDVFLTVDGEWIRVVPHSRVTRLAPVELPRDRILQELAKALIAHDVPLDDGID